MNKASRGFTLIEILVVLTLVGLSAGIALPQFFAMAKRVELNAQRANLITEIDNLGYLAYSTGQATTLDTSNQSGKSQPINPLPVKPPPGWQLQTTAPIVYTFNGICQGGTLTLISPDGNREVFQLTSPTCNIKVNEAS